MATAAEAAKLRDYARSCIEKPITDTIRSPKWGDEFNFDNLSGLMESVYFVCESILNLPAENLPSLVAGELTQKLESVRNILNAIRSLSIANIENPKQQRNNLSSQFEGAATDLLRHSASWIAYLAYQRGDVDAGLRRLQANIAEADTILSNAKETVKSKEKEVQTIIDAAKEAAASVGVSHFTASFGEEAKVNSHAASRWLKATIGMAVLTVAVSVALIFVIRESAGLPLATVVQSSIAKIFLLTLLVTATLWCGRMYRALRHQEYVNGHRANSLKTFQAFVSAASTPEIRDAVLVEAARSIFGVVNPGYLGPEGSSDQGSSPKIYEILRGVKADSSSQI